MALLEIDAAQILELIKQLPLESKRSILEALREEMTENSSHKAPEVDQESQVWLEADLSEPLPEYDWGPEGIPEGIPVQYVQGKGVITPEAQAIES